MDVQYCKQLTLVFTVLHNKRICARRIQDTSGQQHRVDKAAKKHIYYVKKPSNVGQILISIKSTTYHQPQSLSLKFA